MDSILTSIKKLLGIAEEYTDFDADIILHINSVFSILTQLGAGPASGFSIKDSSAVWNDYIPETTKDLEMIKTYVEIRVRLLFDPPISSAAIEALERNAKELEWRIGIAANPAPVVV